MTDQSSDRPAGAIDPKLLEILVCPLTKSTLEYDREKAAQLWSVWDKAWFPQGLDDPELALLRVRIEQAEYWEGSSSRMVQLARLAQAIVTGDASAVGANAKLDVAHR